MDPSELFGVVSYLHNLTIFAIDKQYIKQQSAISYIYIYFILFYFILFFSRHALCLLSEVLFDCIKCCIVINIDVIVIGECGIFHIARDVVEGYAVDYIVVVGLDAMLKASTLMLNCC